MNLTDFAKEVHKNARLHGWWDEERSFGEIIALCHSELSEALEEYRGGRPELYYDCLIDDTDKDCICETRNTGCGYTSEGCKDKSEKPEGVAVELADCIIRILDYCGKAGIDIEDIIRRKHEYNKTRPYRHGGRKL